MELIWLRSREKTGLEVSSKVNPVYRISSITMEFSFHYSSRAVRTNNLEIFSTFHRSHPGYKKIEIWQKHRREETMESSSSGVDLRRLDNFFRTFVELVANLHVVTIRATTSPFSLSLLSPHRSLPFPFSSSSFFLSLSFFFSPLATSFDNGGSSNILNNVTSFRPSASRNRGI